MAEQGQVCRVQRTTQNNSHSGMTTPLLTGINLGWPGLSCRFVRPTIQLLLCWRPTNLLPAGMPDLLLNACSTCKVYGLTLPTPSSKQSVS